jgi:hypothetical protein
MKHLHTLSSALVLTLLSLSSAAHSPKAHEHGALKLDVAISADNQVVIDMQAPLDNLLGFERAPRTDAERQQADAVIAALKAADTLFRIDPAAGCTLAGTELQSAVLQLGMPPTGHAADDGHADLDGRFTFTCKDAAKAAFIDVKLFDRYRRIQRIDVQAVTPQGQFKRTLKRPAGRLALTRP